MFKKSGFGVFALLLTLVPFSQASAYVLDPLLEEAETAVAQAERSTGSATSFAAQVRGGEDASSLALAQSLFQKYQAEVNRSAYLVSTGKRTKYVAILLHGMMMSTGQLKPIAEVLKEKGINSIGLSLASHHSQISREENNDFSYRDWGKDLEYGLQIARLLGERPILVGFSLGGLVATYGAARFHDEVKGLMVLGPALRANIEFSALACPGALVLETGAIDSQVSSFERRGVLIGCQVQKLITETQTFGTPMFNGELDGFYPNYERVFQKMKIPTLVAYTVKDRYVDTDTIKFMVDSLGKTPTVLFYRDGDRMIHDNLDSLDHRNYEGRTLRMAIDEFFARPDMR